LALRSRPFGRPREAGEKTTSCRKQGGRITFCADGKEVNNSIQKRIGLKREREKERTAHRACFGAVKKRCSKD